MRSARLSLLVITFFALIASAFANSRRFIEPLRIDFGGKNLYATVVADFNGDGRLDIAATVDDAFTGGMTVDIALGRVNGFAPAVSYATGKDPQGIALADFNHDGKLDLVTANGDRDNSVSVLLGNGDGSFQAPISYSLGTTEMNVVVADFNGDGDPDVAVGTGFLSRNGSVAVLLGNGDGSFRTGPTFGHAGPGVAAGDLNGDGKIDLVTSANGPVRVFLGKGDGNFQRGVSYNTAGGNGGTVALADFNHDGKLDIATAGYYVDLASVLIGNGDGTFQPHVDYGISGPSTAIAVTDLDQDGNPDLIVGDDASLSILFGRGDGSLRPEVLYGYFLFATGITPADLTGDGKLDLLVSSYYYTPYLNLVVNTGLGKLRAAPEYDAKHNATALTAADVNNDGNDDIIVTSTYLGGYIVTAWLGNDAKPLQRRTTALNVTGYCCAALAAGDFNGDGRSDALFLEYTTPTLYGVLLGNGDGTFQQLSPQSLAGASSPVVADLNGDGLADVAVVSDQGISVLLAKGDGTFKIPIPIQVAQDIFSLAIADFNKDGKLDLAASGYQPNDILFYQGNGDGTFNAPISSSTERNLGSLKSADLNGDGNPDLVGITSFGASVVLGKGDGTFQPEVLYQTAFPLNFVIADFNLDGKPDLAIGESINSGTYVSLRVNNGDGTFGPADDYNVYLQSGLVTGDFNHDGFPDVAGLEPSPQSVSGLTLLLNIGK